MYFLGIRNVTHCVVGLILLCQAITSHAALDLNGLAVHEELGEEQFIAGLYLENLSSENKVVLLSEQRKRMEIKILTDKILSRRFNRLWIEGTAINGSTDEIKAQAQNLADFSNMLKIKMIKNDTLTIERTFRRGVEVSLNGVLLGTINNTAFFDLLLRTWIGPVPMSANLKVGILKAGSIEPGLLSRFENIRTTQERVTQIKATVDNQFAAIQAASSTSSEVASSQASSSVATELAAQSSSQVSSKAAEEVSVSSTPTSQLISDAVFEEEEDNFSYTAADLLTRQLYVSKLTRWTSSYIKYPKTSLRRGEEDSIRVTVTISRKGEVLDTQITEESQYKLLNKEAIRAIQKAAPYPEMPDVIAGETFVFTMPIVFALQ
ncbi:MAG: TonB family protein [Marinagarivorans sp.]|nr:TonB family protein [Marinagarivorans sp.]